jgi:hypothetical protein
MWSCVVSRKSLLGDLIFMRFFPYILTVIGILYLASNSYDEFRGDTLEPTRGSINHLRKESDPETFHNAMVYKWSYATMILTAGLMLLMFDKKTGAT